MTQTRRHAPFRKSLGMVAGLMLSLAALPAVAATCEASRVSFTLTQGEAALGSFCASGNDNWSDRTEVFALTGWQKAQKVEAGASDPQIEGAPSFATAPVANGVASWSVSNPGAHAELVLVLKQAAGFGAFLLDAQQALNGGWSTSGPGSSVGDLSHATLWYRPAGARAATGISADTLDQGGFGTGFAPEAGLRGEAPLHGEHAGAVGVVPLPAAGWLLMGGLGLLGGLGWRRSRRA